MKYDYRGRHFWPEGCFISTIGLNKQAAIHTKGQEFKDQLKDRCGPKGYKDPFTGK